MRNRNNLGVIEMNYLVLACFKFEKGFVIYVFFCSQVRGALGETERGFETRVLQEYR